eukprot:m.388412 g.388412  ORF g.388412 m.388412 type:complete len:1448 (+) comp20068_c0_seq14:459-4802(+)
MGKRRRNKAVASASAAVGGVTDGSGSYGRDDGTTALSLSLSSVRGMSPRDVAMYADGLPVTRSPGSHGHAQYGLSSSVGSYGGASSPMGRAAAGRVRSLSLASQTSRAQTSHPLLPYEAVCAAAHDNVDALTKFVKSHHDASHARDRVGRSLLHVAATCGAGTAVAWLIDEAGVDVDQFDAESGWTALHRACYAGQIQTAVQLVEHGASLEMVDHNGLTALDLLRADIRSWFSLDDHARPAMAGSTKHKTHAHPQPDTDRQELAREVWSWGSNQNYVLGFGDSDNRKNCQRLNLWTPEDRVSILQASTSKYHTLLVDSNGQAYSFGFGRGGRLGSGVDDTRLEPAPVQLPGKVTAVAAANYHSVFVTDKGRVFVCGSNKCGQLGVGHAGSDDDETLAPVEIKFQKNCRVRGAAASNLHTLLFCDDGTVYTFGRHNGQLGYQVDGGINTIQTTPRVAPIFSEQKRCVVAQAVATENVSMILSQQHDVYLFHNGIIRRLPSLPLRFSPVLSQARHYVDKPTCRSVSAVGDTTVVVGSNGSVYLGKNADGVLPVLLVGCPKGTRVRQAAVFDHKTRGIQLTLVSEDGQVYGGSPSFDVPGQGFRHHVLMLDRIPFLHQAHSVVCDEHGSHFVALRQSTRTDTPHPLRPQLSSDTDSDMDNVSLEDSSPGGDEPLDEEVLDVDIAGEVDVGFAAVANMHGFAGSDREDDAEQCGGPGALGSDFSEGSKDDEFAADLLGMLEHGLHTDVTFIGQLDGQPVPAHLVVLSMRGVVHPQIKSGATIAVPGADAEALRACMAFVYAGQLPATHPSSDTADPDACRSMLSAASFLALTELQRWLCASSLPESQPHRGLPLLLTDPGPKHDALIVCESGVDIPVHKAILAARCPYFEARLQSRWTATDDDEALTVVNAPVPLTPSTGRALVCFLYENHIDANNSSMGDEEVFELIAVARSLLLDRLEQLCEAELETRLDAMSLIPVWETAVAQQANRLSFACAWLAAKHLDVLFEFGLLANMSEELWVALQDKYVGQLPEGRDIVLPEPDCFEKLPTPTKKSKQQQQHPSSSSLSPSSLPASGAGHVPPASSKSNAQSAGAPFSVADVLAPPSASRRREPLPHGGPVSPPRAGFGKGHKAISPKTPKTPGTPTTPTTPTSPEPPVTPRGQQTPTTRLFRGSSETPPPRFGVPPVRSSSWSGGGSATSPTSLRDIMAGEAQQLPSKSGKGNRWYVPKSTTSQRRKAAPEQPSPTKPVAKPWGGLNSSPKTNAISFAELERLDRLEFERQKAAAAAATAAMPVPATIRSPLGSGGGWKAPAQSPDCSQVKRGECLLLSGFFSVCVCLGTVVARSLHRITSRPATQQKPSLAQVMRAEERQKQRHERRTRTRSLAVIQIEEKAVAELRELYQVDGNPEELVDIVLAHSDDGDAVFGLAEAEHNLLLGTLSAPSPRHSTGWA